MANPRTIARMQSRIRERAAYCLQFELNDPRAGMVTITRVELAQDLKSGKIYYSTLGDQTDRNKCSAMLASAAGFIQRQVARVLETRTVPHLSFHYDESLERASNMDRLINEALQKDNEVRGPEAELDED